MLVLIIGARKDTYFSLEEGKKVDDEYYALEVLNQSQFSTCLIVPKS